MIDLKQSAVLEGLTITGDYMEFVVMVDDNQEVIFRETVDLEAFDGMFFLNVSNIGASYRNEATWLLSDKDQFQIR